MASGELSVQSVLPVWRRRARMASTSARLWGSRGPLVRRAAAPVTWGAAMEVPFMSLRVASLPVERMQTPGAAMSTVGP
jgi:hypothetical protein